MALPEPSPHPTAAPTRRPQIIVVTIGGSLIVAGGLVIQLDGR
jgi:hypothetical protein